VAIQRSLPGARETAEDLEVKGEVATTPISAFEMCLGAYIIGRQEYVASTLEMLRNITLLPLDLEACIESGKIAAQLRSRGEGFDIRDALIAGVVKRHGETLVTRNLKHFERVDGLKVKKW
jgi:predicted nucleic acid-binding protein